MQAIRSFISRPLLAGALVAACVFQARAQLGNHDTAFTPPLLAKSGGSVSVNALGEQTGGKIVVAGSFDTAGGVAAGNIVRLLPDGSRDPAFAPLSGANGPIHCMLVFSDQRIWIGGEFTSYDGVTRNRLACLNENGTLDTTVNFGTGLDGPVYCMTGSGAGLGAPIYVGGSFNSFDGIPRSNLAAFQLTGALHHLATGSTNGPVHAVLAGSPLPSAASVLVAGNFTEANGVARNRMAAFVSGGTLRPFNSAPGSGPDGPVYTLSRLRGSQDIWVGGSFSNFGDQSRQNLALIRSSSNNPASDFLNPSPVAALNGAVRSIVSNATIPLATVNSLVIGGEFTSVGGTTRSHVAGVLRTGVGAGETWVNESSFNPGTGADGKVSAVLKTTDGKFVIGGEFQQMDSQGRTVIARLLGSAGTAPPAATASFTASSVSDSQIIATWNNVPNISAYRLESSPDGISGWTTLATESTNTRKLVAGLPSATQYHLRLVTVNSNGETPSPIIVTTTAAAPWAGAGSPDTAVGTVDAATGHAVTLTPDGKILAAGPLGPARYLPDGTKDTTFSPEPFGNFVALSSELAVDPQGHTYVGGQFETVGDEDRRGLARLLDDGSLDPGFPPPGSFTTETNVDDFGFQQGGKIVAVPSTSSTGPLQAKLIRLNPDSSLDSSFAGNVTGVEEIEVLPDNHILVWGALNVDGLASGKSLAMLLPDGTLDPGFLPGKANYILDVIPLYGGKFLVAGRMDAYNDIPCHGIIRLMPDGSVDPTFELPGKASSFVDRVTEQPDGRIGASGRFLTIGDRVVPGIVRLEANGAIDESFRPGTGFFNEQSSTFVSHTMLPDLRIVAGGQFSGYDGVPQQGLTFITGDAAPTSPPAAPVITASEAPAGATQISWLRPTGVFDYRVESSADGTSGWQSVAIKGHATESVVFPYPSDGAVTFYRVVARNAAGESASNAVPATESFAAWKSALQIPAEADENSDADGDGVRLLVEYALGMNPVVPDVSALPKGVMTEDEISISFTPLRGTVDYVVEWSDDLVEWDTEGLVTSGTAPVSAALPRAGHSAAFLRLKVSLSPP
jgi:uncharacterized delta-60 repeat protein